MAAEDRKARHRKDIENLILEKAMGLIAQKGPEGFTIRDLADAIEYSPRTIYLYFRNKDAVLDGIVERVFAGTVESLEQKPGSPGEPERVLRQQIRRHIINGLGNPEIYRAVVGRIGAEGYRPVPSEARLLELMGRLIETSGSEEESRKHPEEAARIVTASLRSITLLFISEKIDPGHPEGKRKIRMAVGIILRGLL